MDTCILVTAVLLLGREAKAEAPECYSLVKTEICAGRDLWFSGRKEVTAQDLETIISFGMIWAERALWACSLAHSVVRRTKITLLSLAVPVFHVADISQHQGSYPCSEQVSSIRVWNCLQHPVTHTMCCNLMELSQTSQQWKVFLDYFCFTGKTFENTIYPSALLFRAHWPSISLQGASVLTITVCPQWFYS